MSDSYYDTGHYKDKLLTCADCQANFVFTAGEQAFFESKRPPLTPPKRCKACREIRRRTINPPMSFDQALVRANALDPDNNHQGVSQ